MREYGLIESYRGLHGDEAKDHLNHENALGLLFKGAIIFAE
jgi:hypothetical protein